MKQFLKYCSLLKILDVFFQNPLKNYQIREISRIVNLDHKAVSIHLKRLEKMDLVKADTSTLYKSYRANVNEEFKKTKMGFNIMKIQESGLLDYLEQKALPRAVVAYGSFAKGTDRPESDIDIFLDAPEKNLELDRFEKKLGRKIHLMFQGKMSRQFKNNLANGIVLKGSLRLWA